MGNPSGDGKDWSSALADYGLNYLILSVYVQSRVDLNWSNFGLILLRACTTWKWNHGGRPVMEKMPGTGRYRCAVQPVPMGARSFRIDLLKQEPALLKIMGEITKALADPNFRPGLNAKIDIDDVPLTVDLKILLTDDCGALCWSSDDGNDEDLMESDEERMEADEDLWKEMMGKEVLNIIF
ncbi:hypothetical protein BVC80_1715g19 [Macleaya cordata]|uniref:Uncharacterized protein n=1 Tax=Macleaya cordata TaxID=56857 RepID=A0A200Q220_MACCD|nr:hypothetical protein BVC80_1715g19 [Macleaya cordata]